MGGQLQALVSSLYTGSKFRVSVVTLTENTTIESCNPTIYVLDPPDSTPIIIQMPTPVPGIDDGKILGFVDLSQNANQITASLPQIGFLSTTQGAFWHVATNNFSSPSDPPGLAGATLATMAYNGYWLPFASSFDLSDWIFTTS